MSNDKTILWNKKEDCCGCGACYANCNQEAIFFKEDEEGFWYPYVSEEKCIRCHACIIVCPIKRQKQL